MDKNNITFDLDNVIFATNEMAHKIALKEFNYTLHHADWYLKDEPEEIRERMTQFFCGGKESFNAKATSLLIPHYIKVLSKIYNVYFVSSREPENHEPTLKQLSDNNIIISRKNVICISGSNKLPILQNLNTKLHIDEMCIRDRL